jgi:hypothetical protein|tara:strand:- start:328 stop:1053 length:726 start_codon:yes stop_codon:yes gene_type:complete
MIYNLSNKTNIILKFIIHQVRKSAKIINFQFVQGKTQTYITPKKDMFIKFDLDKPIPFDYSIFDLETFVAKKKNKINSEKNTDKKRQLVVPNKREIKFFTQQTEVERISFLHKDLQQCLSSTIKGKWFNIYSENNTLYYRFQNHSWDWWSDDFEKEVIKKGKSKRKFRYVIERSKLRLMPQDYVLICRLGLLEFKLKSYPLSYFIKPEKEYQGVQVRKFFDSTPKITDKHLIQNYKRIGLI